jgi:phosphoribosylpyrophosphate synthetase
MGHRPVFRICCILADAVERISNEKSVSSLFD